MVKHTQTIRRLLPTNCLSVFDHFVALALKGLTYLWSFFNIMRRFNDTSHFFKVFNDAPHYSTANTIKYSERILDPTLKKSVGIWEDYSSQGKSCWCSLPRIILLTSFISEKISSWAKSAKILTTQWLFQQHQFQG